MNSLIPNIVTCSDSKYLKGTTCLLESILYHYQEELNFYIHHVEGSIDQNEKQTFLTNFADSKVNIKFVTSKKLEEQIKLGLFDRYYQRLSNFFTDNNLTTPEENLPNYRCLYKLWISDSVPVDKIIFIDSDAFVYSNLDKLFNYPIDCDFGAAYELWPFSFPSHDHSYNLYESDTYQLFHKAYLLPQPAPYFNTGVMITKLNHWREKDIINKSIDFLENFIVLYGDQDILNHFFQSTVHALPDSFNTQYQHGIKDFYNRLPPGSFLLDQLNVVSPVIVHFAGVDKPIFSEFYITNDPLIKYYNQLKRKAKCRYISNAKKNAG